MNNADPCTVCSKPIGNVYWVFTGHKKRAHGDCVKTLSDEERAEIKRNYYAKQIEKNNFNALRPILLNLQNAEEITFNIKEGARRTIRIAPHEQPEECFDWDNRFIRLPNYYMRGNQHVDVLIPWGAIIEIEVVKRKTEKEGEPNGN